MMKAIYPAIHSLLDVTKTMLLEHKAKLNTTIFKRCLFIVEENERVLATVKALKEND